MGNISLSRATLVSLTVEALFYGLYTLLFGYTQFIIFRRKERAFNKLLWVASIFMFIIATAHISVSATRVMAAFVDLPVGESSDAFLEQLELPSFVGKSALYQFQTYIGDACIIYRTYIIYSRKMWVVALPSVILTACIVFGCGLLNAFAHAEPTSTPFYFAVWALPYVLGTLITNLTCTTMIVTRIFRMSRSSMDVREITRFTPLLVIVESGAIYSTTLLVLTALSASNSNAYTIALDLLCPIIGITFSMIIVRVHSEKRALPPALSNLSRSQFSPTDRSSSSGDILTQPQFTLSFPAYPTAPGQDASETGGNMYHTSTMEEKDGLKGLSLDTTMGPRTIDLRFGSAGAAGGPPVTRGADGWFRPSPV